MHHIGFLDDVFLAFESQATRFLCALFAVARNEVVVGNHFGADKAFLKICVNLARGLRCGCTDFGCPGPYFLRACSEKGLQAKQFVATANHTIESRLVESQVRKELHLVRIVELRDLGLDGGTDGHSFGPLC